MEVPRRRSTERLGKQISVAWDICTSVRIEPYRFNQRQAIDESPYEMVADDKVRCLHPPHFTNI